MVVISYYLFTNILFEDEYSLPITFFICTGNCYWYLEEVLNQQVMWHPIRLKQSGNVGFILSQAISIKTYILISSYFLPNKKTTTNKIWTLALTLQKGKAVWKTRPWA